MRYVIPHYYRDFRCIAGNCPDTCCAGWQIVIDSRTLGRYKKTKGPLGNRIHNSVNWRTGCFKQYSRRCAFLNEEGLCDLISEGGPHMLCRTCRSYPRHMEEFEGVREISLTMSCPEAARILMECEEPVRFLTCDRKGEEYYDDFDNLLYDRLLTVREFMINLLQKREVPLRLRLAIVLALGHDVQCRIDRRKVFAIDGLLKRYGRSDAGLRFALRIQSLKTTDEITAAQIFSLFGKLEVLNPDWPAYIKNTEEMLYGRSRKSGGSGKAFDVRNDYGREKEKFLGAMDKDYGPVSFDIQCEQLAVYFIFTYFCGAVYDGDVYNKVKFAIMGIIWIREMARAFWIEQGHVPSARDVTGIVWRYCKEIEHSDLNLTRVFHLLSDGVPYNLENIISLL